MFLFQENDSGVDDNDDSNNGDDVSQRTHSSPGTGDASPEMFRMVLTNSFGTSELNQVGPEHEVPFGENNDLYLCLEWHPLAEKFFINDGGVNLFSSVIVSHLEVNFSSAGGK